VQDLINILDNIEKVEEYYLGITSKIKVKATL